MVRKVLGLGMAAALLVLSGLTTTANATLLSRLGGAAVYDSDLNITWLADANAGAGSTFDDGTSTTDGRMSWLNANDWAASLTVGGFMDWRLPTALNSDGSGPCFGPDCTGSEMGHLFYNELGGIAGSSILTSGDPDLGLFTNIQSSDYWSSTTRVGATSRAWFFSYGNGGQGTLEKSFELFPWAVRTGDVPEPTTLALLGLGLAGIGFSRRKST